MNKFKKEALEYLKTAGWSFLLAVLVVGIVLADVSLNTDKKKEKILHNLKVENQRLEIQKLYYQLKSNPSDYLIYLKLAILHEIFKEYNQAQVNYEKAVLKSGKNPFCVYRATMFYASQKQYARAIELMNFLPQSEEEKICELKCKLYLRLGKSFIEDKDENNAIKALKIAQRYAKNCKEKSLNKETAKELALAYVDLADKNMSQNEPVYAINALQNSIDTYPNAQAYYKLGLIYQDTDNYKAQKYIEQAFELDMDIVNLELYNRLLDKLIEHHRSEAQYPQVRYYGLKQERLKKKILSTTIFKGDISINNFNLYTKRNFLFAEKTFYTQFDLKNNAKESLNNLFVKINVKYAPDKTISGERKIITKEFPLGSNSTYKNIQIPLEIDDKKTKIDTGHYSVEIFARKNILAPWVLIKFLTINNL